MECPDDPRLRALILVRRSRPTEGNVRMAPGRGRVHGVNATSRRWSVPSIALAQVVCHPSTGDPLHLAGLALGRGERSGPTHEPSSGTTRLTTRREYD